MKCKKMAVIYRLLSLDAAVYKCHKSNGSILYGATLSKLINQINGKC